MGDFQVPEMFLDLVTGSCGMLFVKIHQVVYLHVYFVVSYILR